jgi:hypothetical protein
MSLYYLLLRGWQHLGHSEFFVRSLSVLPALATLPVVYWLGRELFNRHVGLMATALITVNAYHVRYAQEARSYSLYVLLTALSCALFVDYLRQGPAASRRRHVAASALALYAHFYAGLIVVAQWLSVHLPGERSRFPETKKDWQWVAIAVAPAILFAATTGVGPLNWIQRPGLHDLYLCYSHLAGNGGWMLLVACGVAVLMGLWPFRRELFKAGADDNGPTGGLWARRFLLLWLFFPVLATLAVSMVRPMFVARYFVACLPALVMLVAAGLDRLRGGWSCAGLAVLIALSVQGTLSYYHRDFDLDRDDYRAASNYILDHSRPGDVAIFHIAMGRMPYEFYRLNYAGPGTPPTVVYPSRGEQIDYRDFMGKPTPELLESATRNYPRVWIVLKNNQGRGGPDPTTQSINSLFQPAYTHEQTLNVPGVEVRLYER